MARAGRIGVNNVNMEPSSRRMALFGARAARPVGQQAFQNAGTPGSGAYQCRPDPLRYAHGIQRIRMWRARLTC